MGIKLSDKLKACVGNYFRYKKQCILVAYEAFFSDVLAMSESGTLYEAEIKISLNDVYSDKHKSKHRDFKSGFHIRSYYRIDPHYFYFAVPKELANKVCIICEKQYPYAGVLSIQDTDNVSVEVYRRAKKLVGVKLSQGHINQVMKQTSGTLVRLMMKMAGVRY